MKKSKKLLYVYFVISLFICHLCSQEIHADNAICDLWVYSLESSIHDNYAKNRVGTFIVAQNYESDILDNIQLGKGIFVFDNNEISRMVYPIWNNHEIIATFVVSTNNDECWGLYGQQYARQLNNLKNYTSQTNPLSIKIKDNKVYGVISNQWYDLDGNNEICFSLDNNINDFEIINVSEKVEFSYPIQSRASNSYVSSFTITSTYIQPYNEAYCYSYAMSNILYNLGYTSIKPSNLKNYIGETSASNEIVASYLTSQGFKCTWKESGYLSVSQVQSYLKSYKYIYIGASHYFMGGHALVIFGYVDNGVEVLYYFWNPSYNYTQTMSSSTRIITTYSVDFVWNSGYIHSIRK